jgi:electron transfer flavoprotein beta subunit
MGIPCISFVRKLSIEGDHVIAERRVEEGVEVVKAPMPSVITVLPEINTPRIPGVKDTLMASRKPVVTIRKDELSVMSDAHLHTLKITASSTERNSEKFGTDAAEISRFVDTLKKKGVIG